jgi:hypothetical protein
VTERLLVSSSAGLQFSEMMLKVERSLWRAVGLPRSAAEASSRIAQLVARSERLGEEIYPHTRGGLRARLD